MQKKTDLRLSMMDLCSTSHVATAAPQSRDFIDNRARLARVLVLLVLIVAASATLAARAHATAPGGLTQLAGTNGCIADDNLASGFKGCSDGHALIAPLSAAVSPDGQNVYVAGNYPSYLTILKRDPATGALAQLQGAVGCIEETYFGYDDTCATGRALEYPQHVTVSPKGDNVYVTSDAGADAVAAFSRDKATGALTQLAGTAGCVSEPDSPNLDGCATGVAMKGSMSTTVSPDGDSVYVATQSSGVAVFARNQSTGALTQLPTGTNFPNPPGCVTNTGTEIPTNDPNDPKPKVCTDARSIAGVSALAVANDNRNVYVAARDDHTVATFTRDTSGGPDNGKLDMLRNGGPGVSQNTCYKEETVDYCKDGMALKQPIGVTVSPDDKNVYVTSSESNAVAAFSRDTSDSNNYGVLSQLPGTAGCVTEDNTISGLAGCADGKLLGQPESITLSPNGKHAYVVSSGIGVSVFDRIDSGALGQLSGTDGCLTETGTSGSCSIAKPLNGVHSVAVSSDGQSAYATSNTYYDGAISAFGIEPEPPVPPVTEPTPAPPAVLSPASTPAQVAAAGTNATVRVVGRKTQLSAAGVASVRMSCDADSSDRCDGTLALRTTKRIAMHGKRAKTVTLGSENFSIAGGKIDTVRVRLSRASQRLVRRFKSLGATASTTSHNLSGSTAQSSTRIVLKAPRSTTTRR